jgi:hypothetical protein
MRAERKAEKSGKQKKRKRDGKGEENKERDEDNVEINLADPRFKNLHEDHRFAIDPSNPQCVLLSFRSSLFLIDIFSLVSRRLRV